MAGKNPLNISLKLLRGKGRGGQVHFEYTVRNGSQRQLLLVHEGPSIVAGPRGTVRVRIAESPPPALLFYYAYSPPPLDQLQPGAAQTHRLVVSPPARGKLKFRLEQAYGDHAFAATTADPWTEFVKWQQIAESNAVEVTIR